MSCEKIGPLISRVLDGEGSAEDQRRVAEHVRACTPCRREMELLQRNEDLVAEAVSGAAFQDDIVRHVLPRLSAGPLSRPRYLPLGTAGSWVVRFTSSPGAVAAAILLACAGFFAYQSIELHRILAETSLRFPQPQPVDHRVVEQYAEISRQYARLAEKLAESLGHVRRPEIPVQVAQSTEPQRQEPQAAANEQILVPSATANSAPDADVVVEATVVDEGIQLEVNVAEAVKPTAFLLYRRAAEEPEFAKPIQLNLSEPVFVDRNLKPKTRYVYKVAAVGTAGRPNVESGEVALQSPAGDLKVQFIGIGVAAGTEPQEARLRVCKWVEDGWRDQTFVVQRGGTIGKKAFDVELGKEVDFDTGWTLENVAVRGQTRLSEDVNQFEFGPDGKPVIDLLTGTQVRKRVRKEWVQNVPWVELSDQTNKSKALWKGESGVGSTGKIAD